MDASIAAKPVDSASSIGSWPSGSSAAVAEEAAESSLVAAAASLESGPAADGLRHGSSSTFDAALSTRLGRDAHEGCTGDTTAAVPLLLRLAAFEVEPTAANPAEVSTAGAERSALLASCPAAVGATASVAAADTDELALAAAAEVTEAVLDTDSPLAAATGSEACSKFGGSSRLTADDRRTLVGFSSVWDAGDMARPPAALPLEERINLSLLLEGCGEVPLADAASCVSLGGSCSAAVASAAVTCIPLPLDTLSAAWRPADEAPLIAAAAAATAQLSPLSSADSPVAPSLECNNGSGLPNPLLLLLDDK